MPNQVQTPQAGSNPSLPSVKATDGTTLDPVAVNLAKAIREHESNGNYSAIGDLNKGVSKGAYQYNKDNFSTWAKEYGLDPNDFSPTNQDKVAYTRIKSQLDSGNSPSEVVARWNGATLKGGKYVANNPAYVDAVKQQYAKLVGAPTQSVATSDATGVNTAQAAGATPAPQSFGQQALGLAGKVGDFFFPAVKDIYNDVTGKNTGADAKTGLQQLGDVGMSALSLIPGLGEAGGALKGAGLLAKGAEAANAAADVAKAAKVAKVGGEVASASKAVPTAIQGAKTAGLVSKIGKDAALGYGMDVSQKLGQGDTNAGDVLTPGLGTLTGGALGAGGAVLDKVGKNLGAKWINSLIKPLKKDFSYGKNPGRAVAEMGITGNSLDDLASNIGTARKQIGSQIGSIGDQVSQAKGITLNIADTLKPIDEALGRAAQTNNQAVFTRLQNVRRALTEDLGRGIGEGGESTIISKGTRNLTKLKYNGAQSIKELVGDMTAWTGLHSDDKAVNAALQGVWRGISDAQKKSVEKLSPALRTQLEKLNERYGDLTSAEIAAKYREAIHGRQNLVSLGDKLSAGAGLMTGLLTGTGPIGGGIGAATLAGASHLLGTTAAKTRIARALAKQSGKQFPGFLKTGATRVAASQNQ